MTEAVIGLFAALIGLTAAIIPLVRWRKSHTRKLIARFKYLFEQHGFKVSQIPSMLPDSLKFSYEAIKDDKAIIKNLKPEHLEWAADAFNVQKEWLEGAIDEVYKQRFYACYPHPDRLVSALEKEGLLEDTAELVVYSTVDLYPETNAHAVLVLEVPFDRNNPEDERTIYYPISEYFPWSHLKAREFLVCVAEKFCDRVGISVPVFIVSPAILKKIKAQTIIPNRERIKSCKVSGVCLDDYLRPEINWTKMRGGGSPAPVS